MATRSLVKLDNVLRLTFSGGCNAAVVRGDLVKHGSSDDTLTIVTSDDPDAIGMVENAQATAGRPVTVILTNATGILDVKVGTGGATRGKYAKIVSDGYADATANGGGTTSGTIYGRFMQSGVAGDRVGLALLTFMTSHA